MSVCVDLFSGLGSFSQAFLDRGWEVYRYDIEPYFEIEEIAEDSHTIISDILDLDIGTFPENPDMLLISPPCTTFSVAAVSHHWKRTENGPVPKSQACKISVELVRRALEIRDHINPRFWVLENPRAMMRRVMQDILNEGPPTVTTYWASWGEKHYKPTDLWGRLPYIEFKKPEHWEKAPRGSKSGTQGITIEKECQMPRELKTAMLRSIIPYRFSLALCLAAERGIYSLGQVSLENYLKTEVEI